jgi:hypothetical protein
MGEQMFIIKSKGAGFLQWAIIMFKVLTKKYCERQCFTISELHVNFN